MSYPFIIHQKNHKWIDPIDLQRESMSHILTGLTPNLYCYESSINRIFSASFRNSDSALDSILSPITINGTSLQICSMHTAILFVITHPWNFNFQPPPPTRLFETKTSVTMKRFTYKTHNKSNVIVIKLFLALNIF